MWLDKPGHQHRLQLNRRNARETQTHGPAMKHYLPRFTIMFVFTTALLAWPMLGAEGPYHFVKEIQVGGEGGWDYLSVDVLGRRLYVSHGAKVVVIDLDKEQVAGEIADTPG